ncbi:MAG TPA: FAD-dependent oxidoreductase [Roseiarcus sp.]|nr:FAD-dependent oxidoreductase [Roseiarcus sp.]
MPSRSVDVIVLGAGIVGVSAALAMQAHGRTVALVDRLGEAAGETTYGNSGIVQSEAIFPYLFPRDPAELVLAALNRDPRAHIRYGALPAIAPALRRYFRASTDAGKIETAKAMAPFVRAAAAEHLKLAEARARAASCAQPAGSRSFAARAARIRCARRSRS